MSNLPPSEPNLGSQPTEPLRENTAPVAGAAARWRRSPLLAGLLVALVVVSAGIYLVSSFGPATPTGSATKAPTQSRRVASGATLTPTIPVTPSATSGATHTPTATAGPRATATATPARQPTATSAPTATPAPIAVPSYAHVFLIMMENTWYGSVVGSGEAPYLNGTLIPSGALATNYFALTHPSAPNYWALTSGQIPQYSNCSLPPKAPTMPNCLWKVTNLSDEFTGAGLPWSAYYEDMPQNCYADHNAPSNYTYTPNYNPWINYMDVNPSGCTHDVAMPTSPSGLASAVSGQSFAMISPNLCHDMHNCPISTGDQWLAQNVPAIQQSAACAQSCLIIISWDEDDTYHNNQVATIMWGSAHVPAGRKDGARYNHYALLHTIEQALGLGTLTSNDQQAPVMSGMFG